MNTEVKSSRWISSFPKQCGTSGEEHYWNINALNGAISEACWLLSENYPAFQNSLPGDPWGIWHWAWFPEQVTIIVHSYSKGCTYKLWTDGFKLLVPQDTLEKSRLKKEVASGNQCKPKHWRKALFVHRCWKAQSTAPISCLSSDPWLEPWTTVCKPWALGVHELRPSSTFLVSDTLGWSHQLPLGITVGLISVPRHWAGTWQH